MRDSIYVKDFCIPYTELYVNMEFKRGLNYIQGNNGSGKTILLDYLSGIRKDRNNNIQGNESIVYINQNIFFSDRLKGKDFLEFVYKLDNIKKTERKRKTELLIRKFDINGNIKLLLDKQWGMLSGGEKKYLYSIILLSLEREWYILDEPFAFVDNEKKEVLWKVMKEMAAEGKGIILTSHEKDENLYGNDINVIDM